MFENQMNPFAYDCLHDSCRSENEHTHQYNVAFNQFKAARARGNFFRLKMKVLRRQPFLYDLDAIKSSLHVHGSSYAGIKVVQISSIIGSEGRISDFDSGFHPMREVARERWINIAMAHIARLPLPPIHLIQIGDSYFLRDGHHRVSVARTFGQTAMDAEVITWNGAALFPWQAEAMPEAALSLKRANVST